MVVTGAASISSSDFLSVHPIDDTVCGAIEAGAPRAHDGALMRP
jgi:hypothetical protein